MKFEEAMLDWFDGKFCDEVCGINLCTGLTFNAKAVKLTASQCLELSTDDIDVKCAYFGKDIDSIYYGKIKGVFVDIKTGNAYTFNFSVRKIQNMTNTALITPDAVISNCYLEKDVAYGVMGVWSNTTAKYIAEHGKQEDLNMKMFIKQLKRFCTYHKLCYELRKIEKRKTSQPYVEMMRG